MGSARVSRVGERVLAVADFSFHFHLLPADDVQGNIVRRDAETITRDACATLTRLSARYMTMPPSTHSTWPVM
jgi:hypothetical protein